MFHCVICDIPKNSFLQSDSGVSLSRILHRTKYKKIKRIRRYNCTNTGFAIITISLSMRNCSQTETEDKHMHANLFILHRNATCLLYGGISTRYVFSSSYKLARFIMQSPILIISANMISCKENSLIFQYFHLDRSLT